MQRLDGQRPEISYPCSWTYRIISSDEENLRTAVSELVSSPGYSLKRIGASGTGRYIRMELVTEVRDEAERNALFVALEKLPHVRFVL